MRKKKIKTQILKRLKNIKSPGKENYKRMIINIYQKNDIYPFGPPTLSRQIKGGEKKKRKERKKKVTMDEKEKKCLESTSKNKNGKN